LAERAGARWVAAEKGVEQGEADAGKEERIALPSPSARPRPGRDRRRQKRLSLQGVRGGLPRSRALSEPRGNLLAKVCAGVGEQVGVGANHGAMVNRWRRFVS
jgi:hypothetical protein